MQLPFSPKKSLGQNFITNPHVAEEMADAAALQKSDTVLEIGPGTGALTKKFLARGARVEAVEADARAVDTLRETFAVEIAGGGLVLHHADIRTTDPASLGLTCGKYKLLANIPYYLSGILFRQFLAGECQPNTLVFLTQKEVAERICRDKKESLLSLSVKAYGTPRYMKTVPRGSFSPQPNVDSAIIAVGDISKERFVNLEESFFFELLHLGFGARRKQLLGNLAKRYDRALLINTFSTLNIASDVRAEDLPLEIWLLLTRTLAVPT